MIKIRQIKIEVCEDQEKMLELKICKLLRINKSMLTGYQIIKLSIDARNKNHIMYIYDVIVSLVKEGSVSIKFNDLITPYSRNEYPTTKAHNASIQPYIIGTGPAGLFAAYAFVEAGLKPILIERGEEIDKRVKTVESFWENSILNPNSNVQFGEGGAGTFSDGKLNTLTKDTDGAHQKVLETFVLFGAPKEILYSYKPHIGTDILRNVVKNMREYIIAKGGTFRYNTCLTDIKCNNKTITEIELNNSEWVKCECLVLAIGHSARDTFLMLRKHGLEMLPKPFAVGFRIEHLQDAINESQYGLKYKDHLGAASYKLTYQSSNNHGVYSFCMCPGGYVVNASSEEGRLATNGMSNYKRDSKNANSAIIVTVNKDIYGTSLFAGLDFQKNIEEKAYQIGKGKIPVQLLGDYLNNTISTAFKSVKPEIKGQYIFADLNGILPSELNIAFKEAILKFGEKIKGFDTEDAVLSGVESRTSSPIKFIRDAAYCANIKGVYPAGEGSGYSGGITTSAIDGMKVAESIIKNN